MSAFDKWDDKMVEEHNRRVAAGKNKKVDTCGTLTGPPDFIPMKTKDLEELFLDVSRNNARYKVDPYPHPVQTFDPAQYSKTEIFLVIPVNPMGAVRQNRHTHNEYQKKYEAYKERIRFYANGQGADVPDEIFCMFWIPAPSDKLRDRVGLPHRFKPDTDNLVKAVKDALWKQDSAIWHEDASKFWSEPGRERIEIKLVYWEKRQ